MELLGSHLTKALRLKRNDDLWDEILTKRISQGEIITITLDNSGSISLKSEKPTKSAERR